ncbi:hypothetical protein [Actinoplanes sp. DH11]|uniref:hypothetical protein n=1 Tax=Actinoplanes sp. DH11 TaxID=2857011 RepID=UPI001E2B5B3D|nr:hypothetical protein [Actinoplanes sp. DH11]
MINEGFAGVNMLVEVLLDTPVHVHYGFLSLSEADTDPGDPDDARRGQVNGLCGASIPGVLHLKTGLHTGTVQVRVELHTDAPRLDGGWQDVVEVLFSTQADELVLAAFDTVHGPVDLPPGNYRARFCGADMQRGHDLDTAAGDDPVDRYLLQFWPAAGVDRIVRQGSEVAAYWHGLRDDSRSRWTRDELVQRVADLRRQRADREKLESEDELDEIWGDDVPHDEELRDAGWFAARLWRHDRALVEALRRADDDLRRAVTAWAIERILLAAGLLQHPWAARAITALRDGTPLPDRWEVGETLPPLPAAPGFGDERAADKHSAVEAMYNAGVGLDTLGDVCEALVTAAGPDLDPFLDQVRESFDLP